MEGLCLNLSLLDIVIDLYSTLEGTGSIEESRGELNAFFTYFNDEKSEKILSDGWKALEKIYPDPRNVDMMFYNCIRDFKDTRGLVRSLEDKKGYAKVHKMISKSLGNILEKKGYRVQENLKKDLRFVAGFFDYVSDYALNVDRGFIEPIDLGKIQLARLNQ